MKAYTPTIVTTDTGVAAVSLAAFDVETTRLRRQRNAFVVLSAILAVVLVAVLS